MRDWGECGHLRTSENKMAATSGLPVPKDQKCSQSFSKLPASKQELSFELIKGELSKGALESVECEELSRYCSKLQLKTTGTKGELIKRLAPLKEESLFNKRVNQISKQYKFKTSLSRENVPQPSAGWKFDTALFPKIKQENIDNYQSAKRQGKQGQYRKALRMFQSRRMKTIKVLKMGESEVFIKASVLKSFTNEVTRTVTVKFNGNIHEKAYCECPVGNCGLCCHAILVLLQLKHFTRYNKLLLALTCTQKLQTWNHPNTGKKDSAKVKTASHIRLKYFRNARSARKSVTQKRTKKKPQMLHGDGSNIDKSDWLSRDISKISSKVEDGLNRTNVHISNHFLKTLAKYKIQSGLYLHLSFQNAFLCRLIHHEHNYAKQPMIYDDTVLAPRFADKTEDVWHSVLDPTKSQENVFAPSTSSRSHSNESVFSEEKTDELLNLMAHSTEGLITVKIPKCENVELCGNNYVDVIQGSKEWLASRVGIITASKIPALLGLCGQKEFDSSWFCIHNKLDESLHKPKKFKNFERGKIYERAALDSFTKISGKLFSNNNLGHCGYLLLCNLLSNVHVLCYPIIFFSEMEFKLI